MKKTIESKVAEAILEKKQEVTIGSKTYQVAPPSTATLILVSELVAQMPSVKLDASDVSTESLRIAKECAVLGDIIAVLILGAKKIRESQKAQTKQFWFMPKKAVQTTQDELAAEILNEITPSELNTITQRLLAGMEIAFFFGITSFLIGINLTKPTKEETTASGQ